MKTLDKSGRYMIAQKVTSMLESNEVLRADRYEISGLRDAYKAAVG